MTNPKPITTFGVILQTKIQRSKKKKIVCTMVQITLKMDELNYIIEIETLTHRSN